MQPSSGNTEARTFKSLHAAGKGVLHCLAWISLVILVPGCQRAPDVETFLRQHWIDPIPPQGSPPSHFSDLEASLSAKACANCHEEQYAQWRTSLHSHAMGSGIQWQLDLLGQSESNKCLRCHAPLAEQKALVALQHDWEAAPTGPAPAYVGEKLANAGLVCASCHVRGHRRYGPKPRRPINAALPHDGFVVSQAFSDSRFCAACHQFPESGARLAGKLREDTLAQWLASPYAGKQSCQDCHMPERQHLWRGIHDPEMLRRALKVDLSIHPLEKRKVLARVRAKNVGAGHHLPTYMVAKIDLVLLLHEDGQAAVELARDVIGWRADTLITREEFDTRLPAGASRDYEHAFMAPPGDAWSLELRVEVAPREHYERMFRLSLNTLQMQPETAEKLKHAIEEAVSTRYVALSQIVHP